MFSSAAQPQPPAGMLVSCRGLCFHLIPDRVIIFVPVSGSPPHQVAFWNEVAETKFDFQNGVMPLSVLSCVCQ